MSRSACYHEDSAADAARTNGAPSLSQRCFLLHCSAAVTTQKIPAVGNPSDRYTDLQAWWGGSTYRQLPPHPLATWLLELIAVALPAICPC